MSVISVIYDNTYHIEQLVSKAEISGDIQQATRKLELTLVSTHDGVNRFIWYDLGRPVVFYADGVEMFRGYVFTATLDEKGNQTLTCYDAGAYLTKNQETQKYLNMKASDIIKSVCKNFNIPMGTITDTGYKISRLLMRDKTLWDIMVTAVSVTKKESGVQYWLNFDNGVLNLYKRTEQVSKWMIQDYENMYGLKTSKSIEDVRNRVVLIAGDIKDSVTRYTADDKTSISQYGLMQYTESADTTMTKSQIQQRANEILKDKVQVNEEMTIECVGILDVKAGCSVYVREHMNNIAGAYYVQSDTHTFEGDSHKMELIVKATDDLPKLDYNDKE